MTEQDARRLIWAGSWRAYGEAPSDERYAYWLPKVPLDPEYYDKRIRGWQAGGADVARFGEYAVPPTPDHAVPPFPGDVTEPPVDPPVQPPTVDLSAVLAKLDAQISAIVSLAGLLAQYTADQATNQKAITAQLDAIAKQPITFPAYRASLFGAAIVLRPDK